RPVGRSPRPLSLPSGPDTPVGPPFPSSFTVVSRRRHLTRSACREERGGRGVPPPTLPFPEAGPPATGVRGHCSEGDFGGSEVALAAGRSRCPARLGPLGTLLPPSAGPNSGTHYA